MAMKLAPVVVAASLASLSSAWVGPAVSGEADVLAAGATAMGGGRYSFEVTVRHADTGWKHYANRWEVVAPDGTVLATRVLLHPHVREQPFTRRLGGVAIPAGIDRVMVRAHDKEHGLGGVEVEVKLPR
jgi:hypothetical protein